MEMQFNVAQLLKEAVGATRNIEFGTPTLVLSTEEDGSEIVATDVEGRVRLTRLKSRLRGTGYVKANVELECDRCLDHFVTAVQSPLEEIFQQIVEVTNGLPLAQDEYVPREDDDLFIDKNHILDMSEAARQALLVSLPMRALCRPDCRGLCPTCGKNLNEGDCDCAVEDLDPRFAKLENLLADTEIAERISKN